MTAQNNFEVIGSEQKNLTSLNVCTTSSGYLEYDEVHVGCPHHIGVVRRLLHVFGGERVETLEDVLAEERIEPFERLHVFFFIQHRERGYYVFVQQQLQRRLPELVDTLSVQPRMKTHYQVGLFNSFTVHIPRTYMYKVQGYTNYTARLVFALWVQVRRDYG